MKSSVAVFTREDPFPPLPVQKTWYHPSLRQNRTQKKSSKKTSSPVRPSRPPNPLSTEEQRQQDGPSRKPGLACLQTPADDHLAFQESWPSTDVESPSTETTFSSNMDTPGPAVAVGQHQQDSVLARYVERFRYSEPRSRAERHPVSSAVREEARPFWWMSPSSLPSSVTPPHPGHMDDMAPLKEHQGPVTLDPVERRGEASTLSPYRELLDISALDMSDSSLGDSGDLQEDRGDTDILQERASRLLRKSQSSVSSGSVVISSEGIGGSDFSSPVSLNEPLRRPFFPSVMESTTYNPTSASPTVDPSPKSTVPSSSVSRQRPEEDILFQWRLRRKMEQARQWPQSLSQQFHQTPSTWQSPPLHEPPVSGWVDHMQHQQKSIREPEQSQRMVPHFLPVSQLGNTETHTPFPRATGTPSTCPPHPASSQTASNPQAVMVPLLCEGSPGLARSSTPTAQQKALGRPPKNTTPEHSQAVLDTVAGLEKDVGDRKLCPLPGSSESTKEEWSAETLSALSQNKKMTNRKQKRSTRCHTGDGPAYQKVSCSRHGLDKTAGFSPQKLSHNKDKRQKKVFHQEVCSAQHAPSAPSAPSPVHQALRQAVSEGLFPTRCASSSSSTRRTPPAPPQFKGPYANTQKPVEVASQLLWEAEVSDGDEFEDDALLQVLRNQRTWVKEQISQVDSLLEEFQQEGEVA